MYLVFCDGILMVRRSWEHIHGVGNGSLVFRHRIKSGTVISIVRHDAISTGQQDFHLFRNYEAGDSIPLDPPRG